MKNIRRAIAGVLSAIVLAAAPLNTLAMAPMEIIPISAPVEVEEQNECHYLSFSGIVQEINHVEWKELKWKHVLVANEAGELVNFVVSDETVFVTHTQLAVGVRVTGLYDANLPMIMIYPMQPNAVVMAVELPEEQNIKIDRFDDELLSYDKDLKLNVWDQTEVLSQDGAPYAGSLTDHKLVVLYSFTTMSIPPQTTPLKVIVLDETEANEVTSSPEDMIIEEIIVENKPIDSPAPFLNADYVVMVPLRAVAEALGYTVGWDEATQTVNVGVAITLTIGRDYYTFAKMSPLQLGTAPVVVAGRTFVPLHFFHEVMRMNNAYVLEGQIVIDNGETIN